jgi:hypothetical protein
MVSPSQAAGGAGVNPVCRIRIPPPGDSHFFSADPAECARSLANIAYGTSARTPTTATPRSLSRMPAPSRGVR